MIIEIYALLRVLYVKNKSIWLSLVVKTHNELVNKMYIIVSNHAVFTVDKVQSYY